MANPERSVIGVVAAEVNSIEQRQIMKGVIGKAQSLGHKVVVFSNVYNPYDYDEELALENQIYEMVSSQELCGIIMIAESFVNMRLRQQVKEFLTEKSDIPIIIIGIYIPELAFPNVRFINASDADDMEDITDHLLREMHLTKIDILTGMKDNEAAEQRLEGYRHALERAGIPLDAQRIHYGDFWMTSGEKLAERYISGELPLPEAIVCANDYMAYGLLDAFLQNGVRVPEDVIVTGYEYVYERVYHSPLLTTYQRGRKELGETAVSMICCLANGEEPEPFHPPKGQWIAGNSCPESTDARLLDNELQTLRVQQQYNKWNVCGTMEQRLTQCSNLEDFLRVLGEHHFLVRWVQNMYLCLLENWYDTNADAPSDIMTCRSIMPWNSWMQPVTCSRYQLTALYANAPETAVHYYLPLFFERHLFGYFVLEYHSPDTYDDIFRNWIKSISIGLEILCMKNDIRYLLQCQNLSEQLDSLTGLYNVRGLEKAIAARFSADSSQVYAIALKIGVPQSALNPETHAELAALIQNTAEVLRSVIGTQNGICGRVDQQIFLCIGFRCDSQSACEQIRDKLVAVVLNQTNMLEKRGMESVITCCTSFSPESAPTACIGQMRAMLAEESAALAKRKSAPHANTLFSVRNHLYQELSLTAEEVCKQHSFSAGYFRQIYKECFRVSFHQDAINARISRAVYLLSTTVLSIASVAEQCGYEDYNYFLRQFQKVTGMTPGQYRKRV